jgi:hypothetical protein
MSPPSYGRKSVRIRKFKVFVPLKFKEDRPVLTFFLENSSEVKGLSQPPVRYVKAEPFGHEAERLSDNKVAGHYLTALPRKPLECCKRLCMPLVIAVEQSVKG